MSLTRGYAMAHHRLALVLYVLQHLNKRGRLNASKINLNHPSPLVIFTTDDSKVAFLGPVVQS